MDEDYGFDNDYDDGQDDYNVWEEEQVFQDQCAEREYDDSVFSPDDEDRWDENE
jgi:hypothetical protein